ncbi:hypothetical protein ACFL34_00965 [Candidatus Sumerlaeota bacterium]
MAEGRRKSAQPPKAGQAKVSELTKREYFAARALQGLLARGKEQDSITANVQLAAWYADELLRELEGELDHRQYDPLKDM